MDGEAREQPTQADPAFWAGVARRVAPLTVVLLLWWLCAENNLSWLQVDNTPPAWDTAVHLTHSLYYYAYLTRMNLADALAGLGVTSVYYPPLVHLAGAVCFRLFGALPPGIPGLETADVAALANLFFLAVLLFSTYAIAARLYGKGAGVTAAFLVAVYPILAGQSRDFLLDYPLAALTTATMALLLYSSGLTHPVWVWPLGLAAGAALACKWSFPFIAAAPFALALRDGLRRLRAGSRPDLTPVRFGFNLAVVAAAVLLVSGFWYLTHLSATVRELLTSNQTWQIDRDPAVLSFGGLTYYLRALTESQIFGPLTLLAGFGAWYGWVHREHYPGSGLVFAWLIGGWVALTLVPNKDPRFSMPLLPALAVLSTSWLAPPPPGRRPSRSWRRVRLGLVAGVVVLGTAEFFAVAYGVNGFPPVIGPRICPLWASVAHYTRHAVRHPWPHEELACDIGLYVAPGGRLGVLPNTAHVNFLTIRYYVCRQLFPHLLDASQMVRVDPLVTATGRPATVESILRDGFDAVLFVSGDQGAHSGPIDATVRHLRSYWSAFTVHFEEVGRYRMPGGELLTLYRRRG